MAIYKYHYIAELTQTNQNQIYRSCGLELNNFVFVFWFQ